MLAYALPCAIGLVAASSTWRRAGRGRETWPYALVLSWLAAPLVIAVVGSLAAKPMLVNRYLIVSLPALAIFAGVGVSRVFSRRVLAGLVLLPVVALSDRAVWYWYHGSPNDDWRAASRYVLAHDRSGDTVLFDQPNGVRLWHYYTTEERGMRPALLDESTAPPRIWFMESYGGRAVDHPILRRYDVVASRDYGSMLTLRLYERTAG